MARGLQRWRPRLAWMAPFGVVVGIASAAHGAGLQPCAYSPASSHNIVTAPDCASVTPGGALRLQPGRLDDMRFDSNGLAAVQVGRLFFYVARNGRSAPVAGVEGHAVEFHDGLAPSPRRVGAGYRIGYIDEDLSLAIPARWDGGLDFNEGRAEVCHGCTIAHDGDFEELQGGLWGCIDTGGREVVPVKQDSPDDLDCAGN